MRIEQLTFTRFVAAISIVIFHYGKKSFLFNNEYVSFIFERANIGVSYFFILSGFVMIIAYGNKNIDAIDYLKNRLARIYPIYFLAIVLLIPLKYELFDIIDLLLNIIMLQSWFPERALTVNYVGWSLSVEIFFYILFPFLLNNLYSKTKLKFNFIWIVSFWIISQILFHFIMFGIISPKIYSTSDILYHPIMHLNEFLVGNLAGLFFIDRFQFYRKNYLIFIIIFLLALLLLLKFPIGLNYHNGLMAVIFIPLILLISSSTDKITKVFCNKGFLFLGEISFGIYLYQNFVWIIFSDYRMKKYLHLDKDLDYTSIFMLRLLALILISAISYLYIEKPMRNFIKRKIGNQNRNAFAIK
ncbi:acyltransferase [Flavobacterium sp. HBTb2-11-1]|uniref:acyltransferase family protein n=1 Tax=Flavobacterium sp. HBTb2-11-1 TaxID=2692212 RepID=UPI001367FBCF|nr:acyltransferase family protein [Flavobacterium sp. HBTb2-11-1]